MIEPTRYLQWLCRSMCDHPPETNLGIQRTSDGGYLTTYDQVRDIIKHWLGYDPAFLFYHHSAGGWLDAQPAPYYGPEVVNLCVGNAEVHFVSIDTTEKQGIKMERVFPTYQIALEARKKVSKARSVEEVLRVAKEDRWWTECPLCGRDAELITCRKCGQLCCAFCSVFEVCDTCEQEDY